MIWVFLGYASAIYAAFAAATFVLPAKLATPLLTWWPMLVIGIGSQALAAGVRGDWDHVSDAFRRGVIGRLRGFAAGAATGAAIAAVGATLYWTQAFWTKSYLVALVIGLMTLLVCPNFLAGWLRSASRDVTEAPTRGFPVVTTAPPPPQASDPSPRRRRVDV